MSTESSEVSDSIQASLRGFSPLGYNWDGLGGLPMRSDVADTAVDVFVTWQVIGDAAQICPMPDVSLNTNGTVEIAFAGDDGRELLLTVECLDVITYIKAFGDHQTSIEGVVRLDNGYLTKDSSAELEALFAWLIEE